MLVIIAGRPGSGKTTLARILAAGIRCPLISRDEIKEGYINTVNKEHAKITKEENIQIYETFFNTIELLLDNNITIIAEAAYQHKLWQPKFEVLREKSDIKIIVCKTDPDLAYNRFLERKNKDAQREYFHGDAAAADEYVLYEAPQFPVPLLEVDTTNEYRPDLSEIIFFAWRSK